MKWLTRIYKIGRIAVPCLAVSYLLLLCFPQALFAYSTSHASYDVHSRTPIVEDELVKILDSAEARLKTSPMYDAGLSRDIFLTDEFGMYALFSHKAFRSFANSVPFIDNVFVNKSDTSADRVFIPREKNNSRSLSGVIAHEVTHLFIRKKYGTFRATWMPTWKNEGYCEYVAGDSTITLDEGVRRWRENPSDDTGYRYIKYHLMVKHLLENEHLTVEDLFTKSFDETALASRTFESLGSE